MNAKQANELTVLSWTEAEKKEHAETIAAIEREASKGNSFLMVATLSHRSKKELERLGYEVHIEAKRGVIKDDNGRYLVYYIEW